MAVLREVPGAAPDAGADDEPNMDDLLEDPKEAEEIIELSEGEEDCAPKIVAPDPGAPSAEEREEHRVDHFPYRCWCEHCVQGRGTGEQHRRGQDRIIPTLAFDYLLVTKDGV